jgi:transposase InsO family protein
MLAVLKNGIMMGASPSTTPIFVGARIGFELGCDNGDKVLAFALDCCNREAMGFVATTEGIKGEHVRDLMVTAVEHRSIACRRPSNG